MSEPDYTSLWDRIDCVLEQHALPVFRRFQSPATLFQIQSAEEVMDVTLPDDVRAAFLRHNGCMSLWQGSRIAPGAHNRIFLGPYNWCDLDSMVKQWQRMNSHLLQSRRLNPEIHSAPEPWWDELQVRPEEWNVRWIPIGLQATEAALYIDMDPALQGIVGQLIDSDGSPDSEVYAPGFNEYFAALIDGLEAGLITYDEQRGFVSKPTNQEILRFFPELSLFSVPRR
jgi:internalin A